MARPIRQRSRVRVAAAAVVVGLGADDQPRGCTFKPILEAAHITPYCYGGTFSIENGLLLRAEIHTLFDLGMITIYAEKDPMIIKISELLDNTEYVEFHNQPLLIPKESDYSPDKYALERHSERYNLDYLCY
ncbi:HNH endonuclease [Candidatus Viridilinea mediisalina]|uniref:HNH nuclease domain-containing protein n=1 Tax=Candidatus Viridilinea mediisalina TaxID=2024553 RepID=A0A2A6RQ21_9CHLR|nr:hypothetical protein CJ255_00180 [Candidatus Viridilinea mediisalina]